MTSRGSDNALDIFKMSLASFSVTQGRLEMEYKLDNWGQVMFVWSYNTWHYLQGYSQIHPSILR